MMATNPASGAVSSLLVTWMIRSGPESRFKAGALFPKKNEGFEKRGGYQQFRDAEGDIEVGFKEIVKLQMHDATPKRNMIPIPSNYEISYKELSPLIALDDRYS